MKALLLLLFALESIQAAWIPHPSYPAFWGTAGSSLPQGSHAPGNNPARVPQGSALALHWVQPFAGFHEMGVSGEWGRKDFRIGGSLNGSSLGNLYRQTDFSGAIGQRITRWWRSGIGYTFTNAWIPGLGKWYYQEINWGNSISFANVLTLSEMTTARIDHQKIPQIHGILGIHMNLHPAYQFFCETPLYHPHEKMSLRAGQILVLGSIGIQNVVSWPGPALGFGLQLNLGQWHAGAGHSRSPGSSGRTGYTIGYRKRP